jgi:uncharacterized membrane protein HdeD (DUF308 family)
MLTALIRNWWTLALRGLLAVIFGVLAFIWPDVTLTVLVLLFGALALVDGLFSLFTAIRQREEYGQWWIILLEGLAGTGVGIVTIIWPGITALVLLYLIAAWALITGLMEIIAAIRLREEIQGEWLLALAGILSVVFALILFFRPGEGALAILWFIAIYAILFGVLLILLAFRMRGWNKRMEQEINRHRIEDFV